MTDPTAYETAASEPPEPAATCGEECAEGHVYAGRCELAPEQPAETVHGCPPIGSGLTTCCHCTPFELPRTDRMTEDPTAVTCHCGIGTRAECAVGPAGCGPDSGDEQDQDDGELTAEEARDLADQLGTQLYRAEDALAFVGECCDIADREGRPVTTAQVREWMKGARCGRQLLASRAADTAPDDGLRDQLEAALRESWTTSGPNVHMNDAIRRDAGAVLPVITRHTAQLRRERDLAIAHDRQPYPTAWAYEQVCKALEKHRGRAANAVAALAEIREYVEHSDDDGARTREAVLRILDRAVTPTGHRPGDTDPDTEANRTEPRRP